MIVKIYQMSETMFWPVGQHPITYFFKNGRCIQHPAGQTTIEVVENLLDTFYLGKPIPKPPILDINTDRPNG